MWYVNCETMIWIESLIVTIYQLINGVFVNISELLGDLLKEKPQEIDGIDSVVVVDNVPTVGPERLEKLQNVIRKIFSKFGKLVNEHYPMSEDNKTKGYVTLNCKCN